MEETIGDAGLRDAAIDWSDKTDPAGTISHSILAPM